MRLFLEIIMEKIPYLRYAYWYRKNCRYRPGHYYSPVVDQKQLIERKGQIWGERDLEGIQMNESVQLKFMESIRRAASKWYFPPKKEYHYRYYTENKTYGYADGLVLYTMLLEMRPRRIIEIGCGFSSALMLDVSEYSGSNIWFTLIEPNPKISLDKLLRMDDWLFVLQKDVQLVEPKIFNSLKENDILFIDGSHVSKTGSDVNYLLTEIIPSLNKGVLIHIHDIFFPFEYPKDWLLDLKLNWNEIYMVHNFLLFNDSFEIVFFSDYMQQKHKDGPAIFYKDRPGSLWLRKIK